mmetsp:Transcript_79409/g.207083  ORF Transcript_79409/g.207083 Transcript_79409/m.207083 type:complete len:213 (-) Transcript_79409:96-734(-)
MPAAPTSASWVSRRRERWAVCSTSSACFRAFLAHLARSPRLGSPSCSLAAASLSFLSCRRAPTRLEAQKNLSPSWMVPVPARLPPLSTLTCLSQPTWSITKKDASVHFCSRSRTRSRKTHGSLGEDICMGRSCTMPLITGNSLHHLCVRRAPANCFMMLVACSFNLCKAVPFLSAFIPASPTTVRAKYWTNRANLSLPSDLLRNALKVATLN